MTIVAAMKSGDRICVMSDTMISDRGLARDNVIPGRLKTIVVTKWLTISYAGLSTQAIDVIRSIYHSRGITTDVALESLVGASREFGDMDFLVCSHEQKPRLCKIANGSLIEGAKAYWIGDSQVASELAKVPMPNTDVDSLPDFISPDEVSFRNAFNTFMRGNRSAGVGGAVIDCLCSPNGHCYNTHAGVFSWETIDLAKNDAGEQRRREQRNKTGISHYEYHVSSTSARGQGIVGFYLNQGKVGFIYDPIHRPRKGSQERGRRQFY